MDIGTFYKQKIYPNLYAIEQKMTRIPLFMLLAGSTMTLPTKKGMEK